MNSVLTTKSTPPNNPLDIIKTLRGVLENKECQIESLAHQIQLLQEKVNYLLYHRFGQKSERFDDRQALLFGDNNSGLGEAEPVAEVKIRSHTRKTGGRRLLPSDLPRVRVEHDLSEDEKQCACGHCLDRIGEETSFQYDVIPPKFQVIENVKFKYVCPNSKCGQTPKTAPQDPPPPLPRTQASAGTLAWIGTSKFVDGLPLNRIANIAEKRFGIPFTSTTLSDWMIKGAERIISPLIDAMEIALDRHDYIHIDENQARVLSYGGLLATAFTYIRNQWPKLIVFIEDGRLALDNNKAERHIRPIAMGRKAWLFAQSEAGAKATALWYSLVETAKANGLEPYWYLRKVFEEMPVYLRDGKPVDDLLPWNVDLAELKYLAGHV